MANEQVEKFDPKVWLDNEVHQFVSYRRKDMERAYDDYTEMVQEAILNDELVAPVSFKEFRDSFLKLEVSVEYED